MNAPLFMFLLSNYILFQVQWLEYPHWLEVVMRDCVKWHRKLTGKRITTGGGGIIIATGELDFWKGTDPLLALYGAPFSFWLSGPFSFPGGRFRRWQDSQVLGEFQPVQGMCQVQRSRSHLSVSAGSKFTVCFSLFGIFFPPRRI